MSKMNNAIKIIEIEVILTFCSYKEYGSQEFFNISLSYDGEVTSARKLLDQSGFFDTVVQICKDCGRLPTELVKISTAANWSDNGMAFDIENGKWSFGNFREHNIAWSDNLANLYGFGKDDDTADCDLILHSLRGISVAKEAAAAIKKAMGK